MEFRNMYSSVLGLNYEQKYCLVCNTPYFYNTIQAHSQQSGQLDNNTLNNNYPKQTFCKVFQVDELISSNTSNASHNNSNVGGGIDLINNRNRTHHHHNQNNQQQHQQDQSTSNNSTSLSSASSSPLSLNNNNNNLFCHSCSIKISNLAQLQTQLEMLQTQINTIRDELGYCLITTFPTTNLTDPNYTLKLKVFQKWSFKYLPQNRSSSNNNLTIGPSSIPQIQASVSHSLQGSSHHHQQQQQHFPHPQQLLHGLINNAANNIQQQQQPPPAHSTLLQHQQQQSHLQTDRFSELINLNINHNLSLPGSNTNIPPPIIPNLFTDHTTNNNHGGSSIGTCGTPSLLDDDNLRDERQSVSSSTDHHTNELDDGMSQGDGGDSQQDLINYKDYFSLLPQNLQISQLQQDKPGRKRKKSAAGGDKQKNSNEIEQCFICGKMLTNDYLRKNHMQTHSDLKPYKCSMCDKSFANQNYKKMHEKTHDKSRLEGEPKFECPKCGRKYHLQKGLYKHKRYSPTCGTTTLVDHGKVRCQCELCGREFNSRYRLGVHVRGFHKKLRPVSCTICGRPCVDNQQRKKHELTHNPNPSKRFMLKCPECPQDNPEEFDRKRDLEKHYVSKHPEAKIPHIRRPTRHPRKFVCSICPESADATFTEKRALEYHLERFHNPNPNNKDNNSLEEIASGNAKRKLTKNKKNSTSSSSSIKKRRINNKSNNNTTSTKKRKSCKQSGSNINITSNKKKKLKQRIMSDDSNNSQDSAQDDDEDQVQIGVSKSGGRRKAPERQSRRISEKYRNMRNIRYREDYDDDDEFDEMQNNRGVDDNDEDEDNEEYEMIDQKDFDEIELNNSHNSSEELLEMPPSNFLQVKLEPEDFQQDKLDS